MKALVKIIKKFKDAERNNRIYPMHTEYKCSVERANQLAKDGYVEVIGIIEEVDIDKEYDITTKSGDTINIRTVEDKEIETAIPKKEVETAKLVKPKKKETLKKNVKQTKKTKDLQV